MKIPVEILELILASPGSNGQCNWYQGNNLVWKWTEENTGVLGYGPVVDLEFHDAEPH